MLESGANGLVVEFDPLTVIEATRFLTDLRDLRLFRLSADSEEAEVVAAVESATVAQDRMQVVGVSLTAVALGVALEVVLGLRA